MDRYLSLGERIADVKLTFYSSVGKAEVFVIPNIDQYELCYVSNKKFSKKDYYEMIKLLTTCTPSDSLQFNCKCEVHGCLERNCLIKAKLRRNLLEAQYKAKKEREKNFTPVKAKKGQTCDCCKKQV